MSTNLLNDVPVNELLDSKTVNEKMGLILAMGRVRFTTGWQTLVSQIVSLLSALTGSGTTANRPKSLFWIGRPYFDTTLGKPIWIKSVSGVTATWVDATGTGV